MLVFINGQQLVVQDGAKLCSGLGVPYELRNGDFRDTEELQEGFGVEVPLLEVEFFRLLNGEFLSKQGEETGGEEALEAVLEVDQRFVVQRFKGKGLNSEIGQLGRKGGQIFQ